MFTASHSFIGFELFFSFFFFWFEIFSPVFSLLISFIDFFFFGLIWKLSHADDWAVVVTQAHHTQAHSSQQTICYFVVTVSIVSAIFALDEKDKKNNNCR